MSRFTAVLLPCLPLAALAAWIASLGIDRLWLTETGDAPLPFVAALVAAALHAVIQIARLSDGTRKVITISELAGMDGDMPVMHDIFEFDRTGIDDSGKVRGTFRATGIHPEFADRLATAGARLRPALFEAKAEV